MQFLQFAHSMLFITSGWPDAIYAKTKFSTHNQLQTNKRRVKKAFQLLPFFIVYVHSELAKKCFVRFHLVCVTTSSSSPSYAFAHIWKHCDDNAKGIHNVQRKKAIGDTGASRPKPWNAFIRRPRLSTFDDGCCRKSSFTKITRTNKIGALWTGQPTRWTTIKIKTEMKIRMCWGFFKSFVRTTLDCHTIHGSKQ